VGGSCSPDVCGACCPVFLQPFRLQRGCVLLHGSRHHSTSTHRPRLGGRARGGPAVGHGGWVRLNPQNCRGRKTAPARFWRGWLLRAGEDEPNRTADGGLDKIRLQDYISRAPRSRRIRSSTWGGEEREASPPDERRLWREEGGPGLRRPVGRRPDGEAADGEAQQIAAAARRKKPSARIKPPTFQRPRSLD